MNTRTGLAVVLTLSAVALAGCGNPTGNPTGTTTATKTAVSVATPRDALLEAVPDDQAETYRYVIKGGTQPLSGLINSAKKVIALDITQTEPGASFTLRMNFLIINKQSWAKVSFTPSTVPGLPKLPKKWMLIDPSKIKDRSNSPFTYDGEVDPGSTAGVFQSAAAVRQVSPGHFAGTTDLTQQTDGGIVEPATLKALGAKAKAVPFTAVVDGQGHLTSTVVKSPAAGKTKAAVYSVTYGGFGTTTTPSVPAAAEQQKAPARLYDMLNG